MIYNSQVRISRWYFDYYTMDY